MNRRQIAHQAEPTTPFVYLPPTSINLESWYSFFPSFHDHSTIVNTTTNTHSPPPDKRLRGGNPIAQHNNINHKHISASQIQIVPILRPLPFLPSRAVLCRRPTDLDVAVHCVPCQTFSREVLPFNHSTHPSNLLCSVRDSLAEANPLPTIFHATGN